MTTDERAMWIACWAKRNLPCRIPVKVTAEILGFGEDDLTILMAARLLIPLGKPATNAPKYLPALEILQKAGDREWLDAATKKLSQYWRRKRERRENGAGPGAPQREISVPTPSTNSSTTERSVGTGGRLTGNERAESGSA